MPTHLLGKRVNLDHLAPCMVTPMLEVLAECERRGKSYWAYSAYRSGAEQAKLWTHGRTLLYDAKGNRLSKVTNAQAYFSVHNYGLAFDVALDGRTDLPGLQPDWSNKQGQYDLFKEVGEKWGFQVGVPSIPGGDPGHAQVPLTKLFKAKEHQILGNWKKLIRDRGESEGLKTIWAEVGDLWPIDLRAV